MNVETSIPMPMAGKGRPSIYPLGKLAVGHSFCVPAVDAIKARLAAASWKRVHPGWDYTSRSQEDGSMRIWRTA